MQASHDSNDYDYPDIVYTPYQIRRIIEAYAKMNVGFEESTEARALSQEFGRRIPPPEIRSLLLFLRDWVTPHRGPDGQLLSPIMHRPKPKRVRRLASTIVRDWPCYLFNCKRVYGSVNALKNHFRIKHKNLSFNKNWAEKVHANPESSERLIPGRRGLPIVQPSEPSCSSHSSVDTDEEDSDYDEPTEKSPSSAPSSSGPPSIPSTPKIISALTNHQLKQENPLLAPFHAFPSPILPQHFPDPVGAFLAGNPPIPFVPAHKMPPLPPGLRSFAPMEPLLTAAQLPPGYLPGIQSLLELSKN